MPLRQRRRRGAKVEGGTPKARPDRRARGGACEEERKDGGPLTAKERKAIPKKDFALPGKGEGPEGKGSGSFPIPDKKHAIAALGEAHHESPAEQSEIKRKVHAKFPGIKESGS